MVVSITVACVLDAFTELPCPGPRSCRVGLIRFLVRWYERWLSQALVSTDLPSYGICTRLVSCIGFCIIICLQFDFWFGANPVFIAVNWLSNWFPSLLWHCWFAHLACNNRSRKWPIMVLSRTLSLYTTCYRITVLTLNSPSSFYSESSVSNNLAGIQHVKIINVLTHQSHVNLH